MLAITSYLETYQGLFVGRTDDYAIQLSNGRYRRVGKPLTKSEVFDHLIGRHTCGTYVMDKEGRCRFVVIDADMEDGLARLWQIQDQLATQGIVSYVEQSRRGGHLWIFFTFPVPASQARAWLLPFCPSDMEFYPKQDEGKGYGSLIRLPLGIHRKSKQRYPFVERGAAGLVTLSAPEEQRIAWLTSIQRMEVLLVKRPAAATAMHRPTPTSFSPSNSGRSSGPSPIREWNASQDYYQLISRHVTLNEKGVGKCPFGDHHTGGEDTQDSFKVYEPGVPGGYCWYCYTWQRGGSLFDFLKYYYHLSNQELWERIQAEEI
ncbi:TOTE conflict system archaeo-eukaryotic primase domain-containing protein [Ktedonobacter racemifer]|uniref:TOTE conflict system archaeo-eukaryotic primase domain-containing protein n=1 Tax=Ktedonobacter racemifer TaxID=363277 RepID=UPI0002DDCA02|nr:hypothetical protein [Ktedonobacter racemifer]